jgi:two-component system KDP operon response regulator KdpE
LKSSPDQADQVVGKPSLRVLVVDDERPIRRFLRASLAAEYEVFESENGTDAIRAIAVHRPNLLLLDLVLPDLDGLELIRRVREWSGVPIIVLSVVSDEQEKVAALDAGADDYLTKPFAVGELTARIRTALRHSLRPDYEAPFVSGDLQVDLARREVRVAGARVALTPTEYDILRELVRHAGRVLTHQHLIQVVWGPGYEAGAHLLRVNVSNLRRKIERDPIQPGHILTEPGVGYRLNNSE